jgi:hypothetical protein
MQIPCPPEQGNKFTGTAKSVAENSESADLEQGERENSWVNSTTPATRMAGTSGHPGAFFAGAQHKPLLRLPPVIPFADERAEWPISGALSEAPT